MQDTAGASVCPYCGYDDGQVEEHPFYLKPRTCLHERYLIGRLLAQGGFGITYIGFDKKLYRKVAIKEYFPSMLAARDVSHSTIIPLKGEQEHYFDEGLQLFLEEARELAQFEKNIHIVNVYNFFKANDTGYMVMQFLEGDTLANYLKKKGGKIPVKKAKELLFPILDALKTVHAIQLYHRDVSPQNIMLVEGDVPVLIDFGAARYIVGEHSRSLDVVLKPGYSPIEQYSSRGKIGPWTDIYACGATFYYMISGEVPPSATDRVSSDSLIQPSDIEELKDQHISEQLNDAILRSLALGVQERFQTIDEFEQALKAEAIPEKRKAKRRERKKNKRSTGESPRLRKMLVILLLTLFAVSFVTMFNDVIVNNGKKLLAVLTLSKPSSIEKVLVKNVANGTVINPLENVYYLEPGQIVVIRTEPELHIKCSAIYGKIIEDKEISYVVPDDSEALDMVTIKAVDTESGEIIDQKVITIQTL